MTVKMAYDKQCSAFTTLLCYDDVHASSFTNLSDVSLSVLSAVKQLFLQIKFVATGLHVSVKILGWI